MKHHKDKTRRQFLKDSITTTIAIGSMHTMTQAETQIKKTEPAWLIACRDTYIPQTGKPNIFSAMEALGIEGVEVFVDIDGKCKYLFDPKKQYSIATPEGVDAIGQELQTHKRKIVAFCLYSRFDERTEEEMKCINMSMETALKLDVPAIRLDLVPGRIKDDEEFLRFAIQTGRRIVKSTGGTKIRFGVENHGSTTNKPEFLQKLFNGVGSDRFGLTLDTANFYWYGFPLSKLYEIYNQFAPFSCHTHFKSIKYPKDQQEKQRPMGWEYREHRCPLYEGDIDFKRVIDILRKSNYQGSLCTESDYIVDLPKEQQSTILAKDLAFLRSIARPGKTGTAK